MLVFLALDKGDAMVQTIITAVIGAVVAFFFWRIEKKIDRMEAENDAHHKEQVEIRIAERELMLSIADTVALTGKKVEDAASVNGELQDAIKKTLEKKETVQEITRAVAIEHTT